MSETMSKAKEAALAKLEKAPVPQSQEPVMSKEPVNSQEPVISQEPTQPKPKEVKMSKGKEVKRRPKFTGGDKKRWEKFTQSDIEFLWNSLKYNTSQPIADFSLAGEDRLNMSVRGAMNKHLEIVRTMQAEREAEDLPTWEKGAPKKRAFKTMDGDDAGDGVGKKNKSGD